MADENRTPSTGTMEMYVHNCIEPDCQKWGAFGFDRGRGVTDWFCFEHRSRGEDNYRKNGK